MISFDFIIIQLNYSKNFPVNLIIEKHSFGKWVYLSLSDARSPTVEPIY